MGSSPRDHGPGGQFSCALVLSGGELSSGELS